MFTSNSTSLDTAPTNRITISKPKYAPIFQAEEFLLEKPFRGGIHYTIINLASQRYFCGLSLLISHVCPVYLTFYIPRHQPLDGYVLQIPKEEQV